MSEGFTIQDALRALESGDSGPRTGTTAADSAASAPSPVCTVLDRIRLGRRVRELARLNKPNSDQQEQIRHVVSLVQRSVERCRERRNAVPSIQYPGDLPVVGAKDQIAKAIIENQVVVVCGATGSGKTTQLPKICLELGRGVTGLIGHTQPRRIAARSVADRIASELGSSLGNIVGYKVRFTDKSGLGGPSRPTLVKLMTDGILLAETQNDALLAQYDTLIIDEAHERSLNIDFLLGYIRQLLPKRPDLKIIITSATIDPQSFADHFADPRTKKPAPVIEVSGRTYPVEVRYRPLERPHTGSHGGDEDVYELEMEEGVVQAALEIMGHEKAHGGNPKARDILVFLPGEREIRETADELIKSPAVRNACEVIPLYARLSTEEQNKVFERSARRRIILATNVAETSLTVPGIGYVIDSGLARISRYSPRIKVQRLPIEPISQASAQQRSGRCGRIAPGVCVRLYSEEDFKARPEFTDPEILRTNLASVILRMKSLHLVPDGGDVADFPFMQPPDGRAVRDGYDTLIELGALESGGLRGELTDVGWKLARLPVDPRIARMIVAASDERCLPEVLIIAAALSVQEPRERPAAKQQQADALHEKWKDEQSDFLSFIKLWKDFHKKSNELGGSQLRKWCSNNLLSYVRMREWQDVHRQLVELADELGYRVPRAPRGEDREGHRPASYEQIHRALLSGLLSNIGVKGAGGGNAAPGPKPASGKDGSSAPQPAPTDPFEYEGVRGLRFHIFPGSSLFRERPKWVMAAELVRTTKLYARTVATIQPAWIESIAGPLVNKHHNDPHWSADSAQVAAYETVSLFGLQIIKRRRIHYGPIDPKASRTIFIQHALVKGEYLTPGRFQQTNATTERSIKRLEEKKRQHDLLADPSARFNFYAQRVPEGVFDGPGFERWRGRAESRQPDLLIIPREQMLAPGATEPAPDQFPDALTIRTGGEELRIPLEYRHKHADAEDGITAIIPLTALHAVDPRRFEWLVPGFAREKVTEMIRALPKGLRVNLSPATGYADKTVAELSAGGKYGDGDFLDAVAGMLTKLSPQGITITGEQLADAAPLLPDYLRMNFRIIEDLPGKQPRVVASGRDLARIKRDLTKRAEESLVGLPEGPYNRGGITLWDFGTLPTEATFTHRGNAGTMRALVALADETPVGKPEPMVAVRAFADPRRAAISHRAGIVRLLAMDVAKEARSLIQTIPGIDRALIHAAPLMKADQAKRDLAELAALQAFAELPQAMLDNVRDKSSFDKTLDAGWDRLGKSGRDVADLAQRLFAAHHQVALALNSASAHWAPTTTDIKHQMQVLFLGRFLVDTPYRWLIHFPRYLNGIRRRLEKCASRFEDEPEGGDGLKRDWRLMNEVAPLWSACIVKLQHSGGIKGRSDESDLSEFRWHIEELRISLFAQELRAAIPVSVPRMQRKLEAIG